MENQRNPKNFINSITQQKQVLWTPKQLEGILSNITNLRDRAYISFVYLTACRESEPLAHFVSSRLYEEIVIDGRRKKVWNGKYNRVWIDGFCAGQLQGVTRFNKNVNRMVRYIDFMNLYVSKSRDNPSLSIRTIPVNVEVYKSFIMFIYDHIKNERLNLDEPLFTFSSRTARTFVNKWLGTPVHFLRHLRLTHLKILHGYDALDLKNFVGWKDTRPATIYVHMDPTALAMKQV